MTRNKRRRLATHVEAAMRLPIGDVASRNVVCVQPELAVDRLEELLLEHDLSGVPVVDGDRRLIGFVAMTDIVRRTHELEPCEEPAEPRTPPRHDTVADIMSAVAFELPVSCTLAKTIKLMGTQRVHRVPVVTEDGMLAGIVTATDIVRFLARDAAVDTPPQRTHLEEADRLVALGFLAGGIAHQANNALTSMRLSLGRLVSFEQSRRPQSPEGEHRIELLQDVREGMSRIERIIRELKAFSHVEDSPPQAVDVPALLDVAIGFVAHEIRHRAHLVCDFAKVPPVKARISELRQVFVNLLVNASQAIPEGEAHINEIRVTTRTDEHGRVAIEIKDSGRGIPPEVTGRIFEPFFTTRRPGEGLGLGLAVTRDVIAALDGEITIDSVVGKGTSVCISLPPTTDVIEPKVSVEPKQSSPEPTQRRRILIVDDDRPVAAAIAFELAAHDVVVAESGREALEILRREKDFDLILCDLMMPEISGIDVYESIRHVDPALLDRVVLMTGGAFTTRAEQFLSTVDPPLLEKPFHPGQLHEVVDALERHTARRDRPIPKPWRPSDPSLAKKHS